MAKRLDLLYQQAHLEFISLQALDLMAEVGIDPHCKLTESFYPLVAASKECEKYAEMCEHGTPESKDASPR